GTARKRHRQERTLPNATADLERVRGRDLRRVAQFDKPQEVQRLGACRLPAHPLAVEDDPFELRADGEGRIEARGRILERERDAPAANAGHCPAVAQIDTLA